MVGINTAPILAEVAPSGGVKESGLSREGSHRGMEEYVEINAVRTSRLVLEDQFNRLLFLALSGQAHNLKVIGSNPIPATKTRY